MKKMLHPEFFINEKTGKEFVSIPVKEFSQFMKKIHALSEIARQDTLAEQKQKRKRAQTPK